MNSIKYIMVMVVAVAGAISAAAAGPGKVEAGNARLDSIVDVHTNGYRSKRVYEYDSKGRTVSVKDYSLRNSNWIIDNSVNTSYDDKDRVVFKETFNYKEWGSWGTRLATEYDDEARTIVVTEYSKEGEGDWTLEEVTEKVLDSQNRLQNTTVSNPDKGWSYVYLYEYNDDGKFENINVNWREKPEDKYQPWRKYEWTRNGNAGTMIVSGLDDTFWRNFEKHDFKLNAYGDTAQTTSYYWEYEVESPESGEWRGTDRYAYRYDDQRRLIECTWYEAGEFRWYEMEKEKYQYGQYGIERISTYGLDEQYRMAMTSENVYKYDDSGMLDCVQSYVINHDTGNMDLNAEKHYYYSQSGLAVPTVGTVRMSGLTLELGEEQPVKVYTVGGCLVYSGRTASVQLPAPGLYLVKTPATCAKVLAR